MEVWFERVNWKDTIQFALGFSWQDWHMRQLQFWVDFLIWSLNVFIRLGGADNGHPR
jgi:hypothetical protein